MLNVNHLSRETKIKMSDSGKARWKKESSYIDGSGSYGTIARRAWEEYWREKPPKGYYIHHVDGDRSNNNIWNLALVLASRHREIHAEKKRRELIHNLINKDYRFLPIGMVVKDGIIVPDWVYKK